MWWLTWQVVRGKLQDFIHVLWWHTLASGVRDKLEIIGKSPAGVSLFVQDSLEKGDWVGGGGGWEIRRRGGRRRTYIMNDVDDDDIKQNAQPLQFGFCVIVNYFCVRTCVCACVRVCLLVWVSACECVCVSFSVCLWVGGCRCRGCACCVCVRRCAHLRACACVQLGGFFVSVWLSLEPTEAAGKNG